MKTLSIIAGVVGLLLIAWAMAGRFWNESLLQVMQFKFNPASVLTAANSALLVAVFLNLISRNAQSK